MSSPPQTIPKRIVVCCDGTWQSAVSGVKGSPSNITRLARNLARLGVDKEDKTWQQIVWYDSGVGTTSSTIGRMVEGAVGGGLEGNVIEAYYFLSLNWSPGDQIFCFGFSRGAYTARTIAGLVSDIGICSPREMDDFPELWELYKKMDGERFYGSDQYFEWIDGKAAEKQPEDLGYKNMNFIWEKKPHGDWANTQESREVEVVGVFDTVGAIGVPSIHGFEAKPVWSKDEPKFHNVRLNRNIKRAFHALALDEHREAFAPTLYHLPEGPSYTDADISEQERKISEAQSDYYSTIASKASKEEKAAAQRTFNDLRKNLIRMQESQKEQSELLQVWFPGVHINSGGGSSDTLKNEGDMEEMANITFSWMLDQISPYLAINEHTINQEYTKRHKRISDYNEAIRKSKDQVEKDQAARAKESWGQYAGRLASSAASYVTHPFSQKEPNLSLRDYYGWGTGTIIDSYTAMYYANGSQARTPGAYAKHKKHAAPGQTNEEVHPTVGYRLAMTEDDSKTKTKKYTPIGMDETKFFRRKNDVGGWEYSINGVVLPEYTMKRRKDLGGSGFEASAIQSERAHKYVEELYGVTSIWEY